MNIRKTCRIALLLIGFVASPALAEYVSEIEVRGNLNVPLRQVMNKISISPGDEFSSEAAGADIVSILELDSFEDVAISLEAAEGEGVKVVYTLQEKPILASIVFKGNSDVKSRALSRQLEFKAGSFYDSFLVRSGLRAIERYYRDEGYADVRVENYIDEAEAEGFTVTYFIEEGIKQEIEKIVILGILKERPRPIHRLLEIKEGSVFHQGKLEESLENILTHYRNKGYVGAELGHPLITFTPDRSGIHITIKIDEGEKYHIGKVTFTGNVEVPEDFLSSLAFSVEGEVYSDDIIESVIATVHEEYGSRGHIRMGADPSFSYNQESKTVDLNLRIEEGPKVYIRNIFLDGNTLTKDYVIRREIDIEEGEPFDLRKVRDSQSRIYRTGFFSNVRIDMLPAGAEDRTDLVFLLDEQKTGMASLGAGYSSEDKLLGTVRISQENFLGRGQQLSAMWEFGSRKQNYRIDFYEPWLRNTPTPFRFTLYNTMRQRYYGWDNLSASYRETRSGGRLSLGRHFTRNFTGQLRYSLENVRQHDVDTVIADKVPEDRNTTSSITPSLIFDTRDLPFDPSTGYILSISNQLAGGILGGDQSFSKLEGVATYFQPIVWKFVGVLNLNVGSIFTFGQTDRAPIYERFT
ncbi:MAG: outer membrane protein assembly factor BamA, partial [Elusimicrobia bacterium]|nr:outer membrane protein assembly factor BamA [Elusimicrobiota bacterium]